MLNWISLYLVNMLLSTVKDPASPYTLNLAQTNASAMLPTVGLDTLFTGNKNATIAIPLALICAVLIWLLLTARTKDQPTAPAGR